MKIKLHIKNMVCPRCIQMVDEILRDMQIPVVSVELGEVTLDDAIEKEQKQILQERLHLIGLELLEDNKAQLIGKIKTILIEAIHYNKDTQGVNFSTLLSNELHHDYSHMSRIFSSVEGMTIEKFILTQRIEKVKELLFYNELTLSEIAYQLRYSSVAHLSAQFKKETGMTPTQFKKEAKPRHRSLDSI